MVGTTAVLRLNDDLSRIKDQLFGSRSELCVLPISGMGGIGKTTLARIAYNDPDIMNHFDFHAWITISQQYRLKNVLVGILNDIGRCVDGTICASDLAEMLYKRLKGRRYLIVMDDMWNLEVWDDLTRCFPDDLKGSRIIVTTRLKGVADYVRCRSTTHGLGLLSREQSMKLLSLKVFGKESCPPKLEKIGWEIVGKCRGLPLAIVLIAGLLSRINNTLDSWKEFGKAIHSHLSKESGQWLDLLSLSFNHLPQHLKPCFLYLGAFPEDYEISVSRLIMLWVAVGYVKEIGLKSLEEVAEEYLEDLIGRNLVIIRKKRSNGKVKTCVIHDLLRDLILREAEKDGFLYVERSFVKFIPEAAYSERSIAFPYGVKSAALNAHSFLCFGMRNSTHSFFSFEGFQMLRVLDAYNMVNCFDSFNIAKQVNLKYLAISSNRLCKELFGLRNLQTLNVMIPYGHYLKLPTGIWDLTRLRHIHFKTGLLNRSSIVVDIEGRGFHKLPDLQSFSSISIESCRREILAGVPNLRKLEVCCGRKLGPEMIEENINNLKSLEFLTTLKFVNLLPNFVALSDFFPKILKKLTLVGTRRPWKEIVILGMLPQLEVIKLIKYAFRGRDWEPMEAGGFLQLKFLFICFSDFQNWETTDVQFPMLQSLVLHYCTVLKQIPDGVAEIPTLQLIELSHCNSLVEESAKKVQMDQQEMGNDDLVLRLCHNDDPILGLSNNDSLWDFEDNDSLWDFEDNDSLWDFENGSLYEN